MFSGNPFILVIGVLSFTIFFFLLGTRASKKQRERNNKINWSWFWKKNSNNSSTAPKDESEEIKEDKNEE